jgi:hypothetical protein
MKKKASSFKGKVASNAHKQQSKGNSYGYLNLPKGVSIFSPDPDGKYTLDFLPYVVTDPKHPDRDPDVDVAVEESLWYKRPYKAHRGIGGNNESVVCLSSVGKKCPICEERAKMTKEGAEKEETDALKPSNRNLYIVIPLDSKKHDKEIHIFDMSQYLFQDLLNEELEEDEDKGIFPDLEEGMSIKVRFDEEEFKKNKFAKASRIDFITRKEAYDESILDEVPNLDEVLQVLSYEELKAKFFEIDNEDDGGDIDDEDDDKPVRKKKTLPTKKKVTKKVEEDDDDEDEDDEEEDEKPVRKAASKSKPVSRKPAPKDEDEDEEDEDEDTDDDEDEDVPPVRDKKQPVTKGKPASKRKPVEDEDDEDEDDDEDEKSVRRTPASKGKTRK